MAAPRRRVSRRVASVREVRTTGLVTGTLTLPCRGIPAAMRRLAPLAALLVVPALAACATAPPPAAAPPPAPCPSVPFVAAPPPPAALRDVTDAKDRVVALMNASDAPGLFQLFDADMQKAVPLEKLAGFVKELVAAKGAWRSAAREPGEDSVSQGSWLVEAERGGWKLEIALDGDHRIAGLLVKQPPPPPPPPRAVAKSDVPLSLPFHGEWAVVWGGDTREHNHHIQVSVPDQRRAADLLMLGADGKTHKGDGTSNGDYLVYGQEVLAVADGTVETVVDGVPENVPGKENGYVIPGNYVVLRHEPALFSAYMHLQPGKTRVKPGARVKRGAVLGLVGNSGHSSEPHLHFQMQDGPDGNTSFGVEPVFEHVVVTRAGKTETVSGYTFFKNDRIRTP